MVLPSLPHDLIVHIIALSVAQTPPSFKRPHQRTRVELCRTLAAVSPSWARPARMENFFHRVLESQHELQQFTQMMETVEGSEWAPAVKTIRLKGCGSVGGFLGRILRACPNVTELRIQDKCLDLLDLNYGRNLKVLICTNTTFNNTLSRTVVADLTLPSLIHLSLQSPTFISRDPITSLLLNPTKLPSLRSLALDFHRETCIRGNSSPLLLVPLLRQLIALSPSHPQTPMQSTTDQPNLGDMVHHATRLQGLNVLAPYVSLNFFNCIIQPLRLLRIASVARVQHGEQAVRILVQALDEENGAKIPTSLASLKALFIYRHWISHIPIIYVKLDLICRERGIRLVLDDEPWTSDDDDFDFGLNFWQEVTVEGD